MDRILIKDTSSKIGEVVTIFGWVNTIRRHGKIVFLDLRDITGLIQLVTDGVLAKNIGPEFVLRVEGIIKKRPPNLVNPKILTGDVEMEVKKLEVLSKSQNPPFPLDTPGYEIKEETRIKYRYLDLRRQRMKNNIIIKSRVLTFIRNFLTERGFYEIETPILTKTTPEGARDFIVPSRLQKGKFYALPQSPQQYKQLLMVAGFEKYFQIARCFRDEDPRHDRAYGEFNQLDLEMSFVTQEDILQLTETLFTSLVEAVFPEKKIKQKPWPRISHADAIKNYGTDKPDLRTNKKDKNELAFSWTLDFPLFKQQSQDDFFYGGGSAKFAPSHHMFTAPHPEDIQLLQKDPLKVRGLQHDLVLNGYEVGGGSIRIHQAEIQKKIFKLIGFTKEQMSQFDHMLTAFKYGVPPHGGIAPGIDRFLFTLLAESSIREVMAFPALSGGQISVMDAPSYATEEQLKELGISINEKKEN